MNIFQLSRAELKRFTIYNFAIVPIIATVVVTFLEFGYLPSDTIIRLFVGYILCAVISIAIFCTMMAERFVIKTNYMITLFLFSFIIYPMFVMFQASEFSDVTLFDVLTESSILICVLSLLSWLSAKFSTPKQNSI